MEYIQMFGIVKEFKATVCFEGPCTLVIRILILSSTLGGPLPSVK